MQCVPSSSTGAAAKSTDTDKLCCVLSRSVEKCSFGLLAGGRGCERDILERERERMQRKPTLPIRVVKIDKVQSPVIYGKAPR